MKFYELGYSDYEANPIRILCHDNLFTQDEFNEMVLNCHIKAAKFKEAKQNDWLKNSPELSEEDKISFKYYPRVGDLHSDVVVLMETDYGFTEPKIAASFVADDTSDIVPNVDVDYRPFRDTYCDKLKLLRERFNVIEPRDNKINDIIDETKKR